MPRFVLASIIATIALLAMMVTSGTGGSSLALLFVVPIVIVVHLLGWIVVGVAYLLGLSLQLVRGAKRWWVRHGWVSWLIALSGLTSAVVARSVATTEVWYDDEGFSQEAYNSPLVLLFGGILLLVFGVLWAPRRPKQLPVEPPWPDSFPSNT